MERIIWLGPRGTGESRKPAFLKQGLKLVTFSRVEDALNAMTGASFAAAIVCSDWADAEVALARLLGDRPALPVVVLTSLPVPAPLLRALDAGASHFVRAQNDADLVERVRRLVTRAKKENLLLRRLSVLNEEFLKKMVQLEKRSLELEGSTQPGSEDGGYDGEGPHRILVIDDEPSVLKLFELILDDRGYEIATAEDGESGLAAFQKMSFHLVITDKNLPGVDGLEVMRTVKRIAPATEVIMITGYGSQESAIEAVNCGASGYLEKPFTDTDTLTEKLEALIAKQRRRMRSHHQLRMIKERNREFLDEYRMIRSELEGWLSSRGIQSGPEAGA